MSTPSISSTSTGSGGYLPAATYYYEISAYNNSGVTLASPAASQVTATNGTNTINWSQVAGATGYLIYRNTSNSFTSGNLLLANISNGTTTSFQDSKNSLISTTSGFPIQTLSPSTGSGLNIVGWNGQTANLLQIQDSSNSNIFSVSNTSSNVSVLIGTTSNGISFNNSSNVGFTLTGNARHIKSIVIPAEYAGAVLDPTAKPIGTMTAAFLTDGNSPSVSENGYKWTTSQGDAESYNVVVQIPIPSDYDALQTNPLSIDYLSNDVNSSISAVIIDTAGTSQPACTSLGVSLNWTPKLCSITGGTWAQNGLMTVKITMTANSSDGTKYAAIGKISLNYFSKY